MVVVVDMYLLEGLFSNGVKEWMHIGTAAVYICSIIH